MLMLGVVGEYVWRTLSQVRNRDPFVVDAIYEGGESIPVTNGDEAQRGRQTRRVAMLEPEERAEHVR
jgi:hypothetical protein